MSTQQKSMSTQEVADRLVSLCREGKVIEAGEELYGDNIISHESEPSPNLLLQGKKDVRAKGDQFAGMIEAHHGGNISEPQVAGDRRDGRVPGVQRLVGREEEPDRHRAGDRIAPRVRDRDDGPDLHLPPRSPLPWEGSRRG